MEWWRQGNGAWSDGVMECWRNEKKPKQRIPEISDHQLGV
jgi:hypothetical protein